MDDERLIEEIPLDRPHYTDFHPRQQRIIWYYVLIVLSYVLVICTFPLCLFYCLKEVAEFERAVVFRLGRLRTYGASGPGLIFIIPCIDTYVSVDIRTKSFDMSPQKVLTKDSVTVKVDAVIYYRITDAAHVISSVWNHEDYTQLLAATALREVLGTKNLSEILLQSAQISQILKSNLDEITMPGGIKVERVEIKNVLLPKVMQRSMAVEAEASRDARAKVIVAEGEHQASRVLKEAADILAESSGALKLHLLHALKSIAVEKGSRLVLNLPGQHFEPEEIVIK